MNCFRCPREMQYIKDEKLEALNYVTMKCECGERHVVPMDCTFLKSNNIEISK